MWLRSDPIRGVQEITELQLECLPVLRSELPRLCALHPWALWASATRSPDRMGRAAAAPLAISVVALSDDTPLPSAPSSISLGSGSERSVQLARTQPARLSESQEPDPRLGSRKRLFDEALLMGRAFAQPLIRLAWFSRRNSSPRSVLPCVVQFPAGPSLWVHRASRHSLRLKIFVRCFH